MAKKRNPWGVFGLSLITLGIYLIFWWYYVNKEMVELGRAKGTDELGDSPGTSVLALVPGFLIIVPPLVSYYRGVQRMQAAARLTGAEPASGWIALIIFLLIGIAFAPYLQSCLNKVWETQTGGGAIGTGQQPAAGVPETTTAPAQQTPAQEPPHRRPGRSRLLAQHLDHEPLRPAAVELGVEDLLPRAEVEPTLGDRDDHLVVDEQVLEVGVPVVLAAGVMTVVAGIGGELAGDRVRWWLPARRGDLVEPFEGVRMQAGLVVVHPHAGGDVHRGDQRHALGDARLVDGGLDLLGDPAKFAALGGLEGEVPGVGGHPDAVGNARRSGSSPSGRTPSRPT